MFASLFDTYTPTEAFFLLCAILGTLLFFGKVVLMVSHGLGDNDLHDVDSASGAEGAFKLLSLNAITGFFMMFGWIGLACLKQFNLSAAISTIAAFIAGLVTMILAAKLFSSARKLVSQGAQFDINALVGTTANVYQRIPASGIGRVQVAVASGTIELDAISEYKAQIESFEKVEIVRVVDSKTVSVKR